MLLLLLSTTDARSKIQHTFSTTSFINLSPWTHLIEGFIWIMINFRNAGRHSSSDTWKGKGMCNPILSIQIRPHSLQVQAATLTLSDHYSLFRQYLLHHTCLWQVVMTLLRYILSFLYLNTWIASFLDKFCSEIRTCYCASISMSICSSSFHIPDIDSVIGRSHPYLLQDHRNPFGRSD